jgi:hypothetical protein
MQVNYYPCRQDSRHLTDAHDTTALTLLTIEVIERVRSSCLHLSEAELGVLARSMATLELKYLGYASATLCERRLVRVVPLVPLPTPDPDVMA